MVYYGLGRHSTAACSITINDRLALLLRGELVSPDSKVDTHIPSSLIHYNLQPRFEL